MRRIAVVLAVVLLAAVAYGKPRLTEPPRIDDAYHPDKMTSRAWPTASTTSGDTVWYGGTTWAPDSMRWEAIRDSVWTFDSGVGSSINTGQNLNKPVGYHETMEGWFGLGGEGEESYKHEPYFRRSATCAISGSYSMWAGVAMYEANVLCWAAGQGYGNNWGMTVLKTFQYPGSGTVTLSYQYRLDAEPGFDYTYVQIDTTGARDVCEFRCDDDIELRQYTGVVAGTDSVVLTRGATLRSTPGPVTIKFLVQSDGLYSDEDGLFTSTCGHTAVDNIALSGAISDFSDFEVNSNGWELTTPTPQINDWSNIAFVDSLPPPSVPGPCSVEDSVLVFFDSGLQHPIGQDNIAVSPWIDLKRNGDQERQGFVLSYDVYADMTWSLCPPPVFTVIRARWYPSECNGLVVRTGLRSQYVGTVYGGSPYCTVPGTRWVHDLSDLIEPGAEQIQVAIEVIQLTLCLFSSSTISYWNSTPWYDNIRFGVYGTPTSNVPETQDPPVTRLFNAEPNPARSSTRIRFATETDGPVTILVFDVAGRRIRTLMDAPLPAGNHEISWDTADEAQQPVPAGLYFYRMVARGRSEVGKVVVLR